MSAPLVCVGVFESHDPVSFHVLIVAFLHLGKRVPTAMRTLDLTTTSLFHLQGLDLRIEHFHCFSDHGEGGHYHYDVTPDDVQYTGFFSLAEKLYRIDRPQTTHNVGRD